MNITKIRGDFPILQRKVKGKDLVYLDNAATTQKPVPVIEAMNDYYRNHNANIHRGVHKLSEEATEIYEGAHKKVAGFINSDFEETVFTKGTTESLNMLSYILRNEIKKGDEIVLTRMEHHSNLVPWLLLAKDKGAIIKYLDIDSQGRLKKEQFRQVISKKTKIVSAVHVSNVLGTINPVRELGKVAHDNDALFIVDAAQSAPQISLDVKKIDADFLAFSAHKMIGPTGMGVLYGKKYLLEKLPPFQSGGDMISEVSYETASWNRLPWKYEAGTPNMAGAAGLSAAVDYLNKIGMENIEDYEKKLSKKAIEVLSSIDGVKLTCSNDEKRGVFSFNIKGIHPHDVSSLLDDHGIAVRGGHHCAMPLMDLLGLSGTSRASLYFYNTKDEIEFLGEAIKKVQKVFG